MGNLRFDLYKREDVRAQDPVTLGVIFDKLVAQLDLREEDAATLLSLFATIRRSASLRKKQPDLFEGGGFLKATRPHFSRPRYALSQC